MADQMGRLLETSAALIANQWLVSGHMGADVRNQEATVLVAVGTVGPLAASVDDGALHVLIGEMKLLLCQFTSSLG